MKYRCPVCAYPDLIYPPRDHFICPSCGVEFGYDDFTLSHINLRAKWIASGRPWFSSYTPKPDNWPPPILRVRHSRRHKWLEVR